jgi:molecular chaperone IbpA
MKKNLRRALEGYFAQPKSFGVEAPRGSAGGAGSVGASVHVASMEDVAMRTFDYSPFYRSTVGFDQLFDMLDKSVRSDWPPYNIEKKGEDRYRITMAIAGFAPNDIELVQHGGTLVVTGQKGEARGAEMLHQGIAANSFKQSFNLADHVKVVGANLEHGLLAIDLVREVPEQMKPRRIEIGSGAETKTVEQDNQQNQIDLSAKRQSKAA